MKKYTEKAVEFYSLPMWTVSVSDQEIYDQLSRSLDKHFIREWCGPRGVIHYSLEEYVLHCIKIKKYFAAIRFVVHRALEHDRSVALHYSTYVQRMAEPFELLSYFSSFIMFENDLIANVHDISVNAAN